MQVFTKSKIIDFFILRLLQAIIFKSDIFKNCFGVRASGALDINNILLEGRSPKHAMV